MKNILTFIAIILLIVGIDQNLSSSPDGAPSGYAFDKSSNYKTCATSGCHSGTAVIADTSIAKIVSNIPSTGYVSGTTYTFTASVNKPGNVRFGFQASPQDSVGNYKGTMVVTNTAKTKITGTKYITHTTSGNSSSSWSWNWTAPALGSGQVKMSGALMAANNNGTTSGDSVYKVNVTINECFKYPTNLVGVPKGTSALITWTKITCATGYKIMYHAVGSATWKTASLPDTAQKNLTGLMNSSDYEYQIASLNGTVISDYSPLKYFTTLCACPAPAYFLDSLTSTSNRFNWSDDACGVTYKIQYKKSTATAWTTRTVGDTINQYTIGPLVPNTTYVYQFRKQCNATATYNSTWITGTFTSGPIIQSPDLIRTTMIGNMKIYYYSDGTIKKVISQ